MAMPIAHAHTPTHAHPYSASLMENSLDLLSEKEL